VDDHRGASVTDLATRRRGENVLTSVTLVFQGVHYGTFPVQARYADGKAMVLYVVPSRAEEPGPGGEDGLRGPVDCLITDDPGLALAHKAAR